MHKVSEISEILMEKVSELLKPYFMRCTQAVMGKGTYIRRMYEDRARTMNKILEICV
jgi:hypothetical protein